MKKTIAVLVGVMLSLFIALPASATEPVMVVSDCLTDWYVNPDEGGADENQGDRRPEQTEDGLMFSGNMLVHHAPENDILLADVEPGIFVADPAPSLNSFLVTLRPTCSSEQRQLTTARQTSGDTTPSQTCSQPSLVLTAPRSSMGAPSPSLSR